MLCKQHNSAKLPWDCGTEVKSIRLWVLLLQRWLWIGKSVIGLEEGTRLGSLARWESSKTGQKQLRDLNVQGKSE